MTTHTPEPWYCDDDGRIYDTPDRGQLIAEVAIADCGMGPTEEEAANAQLIKASPDMFAALNAILAEPFGCSLCDSGKPRNPAKGHQPNCCYEAARAAVAKAKGNP